MTLNLRSNLWIKKGLIWEVTNPIPYRIHQSPEFILLNSIWKFEVDLLSGRDRETNDMMFNINLKNLCELQPLQSFEVTTFLEDKKNKVQMKCSKITVSRKEELIFRCSFYSLCKKLPGFNIGGDLFILFVFSSSTELGLNVKIDEASTSKLSISEILIWETRKPNTNKSYRVLSPIFTLMDASWKLELSMANSNIQFHHAYQVSLRNGTSGAAVSVQPATEFDVKAFIDHHVLPVQYRCTKLEEASSAIDTLCSSRFDSIFADLVGFENVLDITIVVLFIPSTGLALNVEAKNDMAMLLDCSVCHNRGCFLQEYVPHHIGSSRVPSMNFLPNFESLSEDLAQFMQRNVFADMQLKCGEDIVPVHKTILAARSPVLLTKIQNEMYVNSNVIIDLSDVEPFILSIFLKYLYSGTISDLLSEDHVYKLYTVSSSYAVVSLQNMCRCYLSKNLNEDNFIDFLMLSHAHCDSELTNAVSTFVLRNSVLMKNENWIRFTKEFPKIADEIHSKYISKVLKS